MTSKLLTGSSSPLTERDCSSQVTLPCNKTQVPIIHGIKRIPDHFVGKTSTIDFFFLNYKRFLMRCRRGLSKVRGRPLLTQGRVAIQPVTYHDCSTFKNSLPMSGYRESSPLIVNHGPNRADL